MTRFWIIDTQVLDAVRYRPQDDVIPSRPSLRTPASAGRKEDVMSTPTPTLRSLSTLTTLWRSWIASFRLNYADFPIELQAGDIGLDRQPDER